jgi:hypothetical protein
VLAWERQRFPPNSGTPLARGRFQNILPLIANLSIPEKVDDLTDVRVMRLTNLILYPSIRAENGAPLAGLRFGRTAREG